MGQFAQAIEVTLAEAGAGLDFDADDLLVGRFEHQVDLAPSRHQPRRA
jgi:hypothetical protein